MQQRQMDADSRPGIVVNCVHPGYVDTDMTSHKGPLTIEQGRLLKIKFKDLLKGRLIQIVKHFEVLWQMFLCNLKKSLAWPSMFNKTYF